MVNTEFKAHLLEIGRTGELREAVSGSFLVERFPEELRDDYEGRLEWIAENVTEAYEDWPPEQIAGEIDSAVSVLLDYLID